LILVSLSSKTTKTSLIDSDWEIFKTKTEDNSAWGNYEYFLYSKFKDHWTNGVNMFTKYGDHELANNNATVCASIGDFDFTELLNKFKTLPPNTVVFQSWALANEQQIHTPESHQPGPLPAHFVTSYSSFMKLVSLWKWIDSYKNQPSVLDTDTSFAIMQRTMWQRNLQYTALNWSEEKSIERLE
jgi:hypothetical protein